VTMGPNTAVNVFGEAGEFKCSAAGVGGLVDRRVRRASSQTTGTAALDASAGRVRSITAPLGLVTFAGSATLTLNLSALGGARSRPLIRRKRGDAEPLHREPLSRSTLTNSTAGVPVVVTGLPNSFG